MAVCLGLWLPSGPGRADTLRASSPAAGPPSASNPASEPAPLTRDDPFGQEIRLEPRRIIYIKGTGNWDSAFEVLVDAFKLLRGYLAKAGLQEAGLPMTIYTSTDDDGFTYQAAIPVSDLPKDPPRGDLAAGTSPEGKALKFTHRGPFKGMDSTYETIANYLDERQIEARDLFIEEYVTDPTTTPQDRLVVHVIVPFK